MLLSLIVFLLIILGCEAYIFAAARRWPPAARIALVLPTVLFFITIPFIGHSNWGWAATVMLALLMCTIIPKLLFFNFSLVGRLAAKAYRPLAAWFDRAGIAAAIAFCLIGIYGMAFGWQRLDIKEVGIITDKLPTAFDGYRIVQLSDLHLGTFNGDTARTDRIVRQVNALQPDLIVFTGDLVNFTAQEVAPHMHILSQLQARDGVLSILGNHDYALYAYPGQPDSAQASVERLVATQRDMGWQLLLDENTPIARGTDTVYVAGVHNIGHFLDRGDLARALDGIPDRAYTILLSHDPTHWDEAVQGKTDIALTLSGHTHAMQFKLFGFSPASFMYKYWAGHYTQASQHLYVSPGTGGNIPFRFGAWAEITLITLRKGDSQAGTRRMR